MLANTHPVIQGTVVMNGLYIAQSKCQCISKSHIRLSFYTGPYGSNQQLRADETWYIRRDSDQANLMNEKGKSRADNEQEREGNCGVTGRIVCGRNLPQIYINDGDGRVKVKVHSLKGKQEVEEVMCGWPKDLYFSDVSVHGTYTYTYTDTDTHTQTHTHAQTHTHTQKHTHHGTYTSWHIHIMTHTHKQKQKENRQKPDRHRLRVLVDENDDRGRTLSLVVFLCLLEFLIPLFFF
jgi:hypothetical protein